MGVDIERISPGDGEFFYFRLNFLFIYFEIR